MRGLIKFIIYISKYDFYFEKKLNTEENHLYYYHIDDLHIMLSKALNIYHF